MQNIPVYLFLGFLESGKTKFIQETLCDPRFNNGEKTLLLVCEEGVEEYDASMFSGGNVTVKTIDEEALLSKEYLASLSCAALDRVVIEYNGMWLLNSLFNNMPENWSIAQCMLFADAQSFTNYNLNMRSLVVDKIKVCELVVFNRMTDASKKEEFHKIVRGVSRRCDIAYEYTDSHVEYDDIQDPLPFDINAPLIEIADDDYAVWYRDLLEEPDKYNNKKVKFKAIVACDKRFPANIFVAGRHVMTCCIEDVEYRPVLCINPRPHVFKSRDWIMVTGTIKNEYSKFYREKGPVLYVEDTAVTTKPTQELATFY